MCSTEKKIRGVRIKQSLKLRHYAKVGKRQSAGYSVVYGVERAEVLQIKTPGAPPAAAGQLASAPASRRSILTYTSL